MCVHPRLCNCIKRVFLAVARIRIIRVRNAYILVRFSLLYQCHATWFMLRLQVLFMDIILVKWVWPTEIIMRCCVLYSFKYVPYISAAPRDKTSTPASGWRRIMHFRLGKKRVSVSMAKVILDVVEVWCLRSWRFFVVLADQTYRFVSSTVLSKRRLSAGAGPTEKVGRGAAYLTIRIIFCIGKIVYQY